MYSSFIDSETSGSSLCIVVRIWFPWCMGTLSIFGRSLSKSTNNYWIFFCNWLLHSCFKVRRNTKHLARLLFCFNLFRNSTIGLCSYCSYRQKAHFALKFVNSVACTIIPVSSVHHKWEIARNNFMNYSNICAASSFPRAPFKSANSKSICQR